MKELILIGGGGHCHSCIDVIETQQTYRIKGIIDQPENLHKYILGYKVIGNDTDICTLIHPKTFFLITLGQIKNPTRRMELFDLISKLGGNFARVVSPSSHISSHATIGEGTIVMRDSLINAGASIGKNCIINSKALIEHDTTIGAHCHISTAAIINGSSSTGEGTFIGSNATIGHSVNIGAHSIIGAGTVILHDVPENSSIYGNS